MRIVKTSKKFQGTVAYLPWVNTDREFMIGKAIFWPFPESGDKYIDNQALREHLIQIFNTYIKRNGKPIEKLTVISIDEKFPFKIEEREYDYLWQAVRILCFCSIVSNDIWKSEAGYPTGAYYTNSSDFKLVTQNFKVGDEWVAEIRRKIYGRSSNLGDFKMMKNFTPPNCNYNYDSGLFLRYHERLANALVEILNEVHSSRDVKNQEVCRRILRALQWFNMAHTDSEELSYFPEVTMMSIAFEILLGLGDYEKPDKSKELIVRLGKLFQNNQQKKKKDFLRRGKTPLEASWKEWWLYEFYGLRNDVVHGKKVDTKRLKWLHNRFYLHLEIADIVFKCALKKILISLGYYEESCEDTAEADILDEFLSTNEPSLGHLISKRQRERQIASIIGKYTKQVD